MKLALAIVVLVVFALSFVADYKWRKWMAQRRAENQQPNAPDPRRAPPP
jgi:hypothetical protein